MGRMKNVDGVDMPLTAEEETARDAEEKEWTDGAAAREMEQIRNHRNNLLVETDRQELRDIPASNTVYENVSWPTKPE